MYAELARKYVDSERYEEALKVFADALTEAPLSADVLLSKHSFLRDVGDIEGALEAAEEGLHMDPNSVPLLLARCFCLRYCKEPVLSQALNDARKALDLRPNRHSALTSVGDCLRLMGDASEPRRYYTGAIEVISTVDGWRANGYLLSSAGWAHLGIGQFDTASQLLGESVTLDPDVRGRYFDLALSFLCKEEYEEAVARYERAVRVSLQTSLPIQRGIARIALRDLEA